jgi:hypothetical protein
VAFEHAERDAEEDVESVKEQDIPYAEKRLNQKIPTEPHSISYYIFYQKVNGTLRRRKRERERKARYLDGQTVGKEGEEPREADRGEVDS